MSKSKSGPIRSLLPSNVGIIVMFATLGAFGSFFILNSNLRQHVQVSERMSITLKDTTATRTLTYNVHIPGDSTDQALGTATPPPAGGDAISVTKQSNYLFHYVPYFLVWIVLVMVMMAVAIGSLPVYFVKVRELRDHYSEQRKQRWKEAHWWQAFVVTALFAVAMFSVTPLIKGLYRPAFILRDFNILLYNGDKIVPLFAMLPAACLLPLIFFVTLIGSYIDGASADNNRLNAALNLSKLDREHREAIQVLAVIVVLSLLCSSTLRLSIKTVLQVDGFDIFPEQVSYVYGLFFTLLLGILYFPLNLYLKYKRQQLYDESLLQNLVNPGEVTSPSLEDLLQPKAEASNQFKIIFTVFSPLITSIIGAVPDFLK